jgi:hypothetical protein
MTNPTMIPSARFFLALLASSALASTLAACSQTIDFDVRMRETVEWSEILGDQIPDGATTVDVPGGLQVEFSLGQVVDIQELDDSLTALMGDGAAVRVLNARYEIPENTSSAAVPALRLSVANGATDQIGDSGVVARLPELGAGEVTEEDEAVPWAPQGRQILESVFAEDHFSYFVSGSVFLPTGTPVPTGSVNIDVIVMARTGM